MKKLALQMKIVIFMLLWVAVAFAGDNRFVLSEKTIIDKETKLEWSREANLGEHKWADAIEVVNALNKKKYAGYRDWRLPKIEEILTLTRYAEDMRKIALHLN